ncbi:MAG: oligosaccharide flippase family protein [Planctomycetes bacterium]|nr:oligosaccharide flippase family protein [Planctomycetota bacterium]
MRSKILAIGGHGISAGIATLALMIYGRYLPDTDFGLYVTAFTITTFGMVLAPGGLPDYLLRQSSHQRGTARAAARKLSGAATISTIGSLLLILILMPIILQQQYVLLLLASSVLLATPTQMLAAACRIEDRFVWVAVLIPIPNAVRFGVAIATMAVSLDLVGICIATGIANAAIAMGLMLILVWPTRQTTTACLKSPLRSASPYLRAIAVSEAARALPIPMLYGLVGPGAAAIFYTASLLPRRSSLIGNAIADTASLPNLMRAASESDTAFLAQARKLIMHMSILGIMVAIGIAALGIPILWYMQYLFAMPLLFILCLLIPIQFVTLAFSSVLKHRSTAHGRSGDLLVTLIVTGVSLIALVPPLGISGAVIATAAAELALLARYIRRLRRFAADSRCNAATASTSALSQ